MSTGTALKATRRARGRYGRAHRSIVPALLAALFALPAAAAEEPDRVRVDAATFDRWFEQVSNWGRWGPEDRLGTLNLITPEVRVAAAAEVKAGISVSLARDVETAPAPDNPAPFGHAMIAVGTPVDDGDGMMHGFGADRFEVSFHGFVHTHIDALCHMFHDGSMYNGLPQSAVTPHGAEALSVIEFKDGMLTRGVLIDLPGLLGLPFLDQDHVITENQLEQWESATGVQIRSGDAVLIRTGRWVKRSRQGPWDLMQGTSGVHPRVALWFRERDVALVGSDATMDALPSLAEDSPFPFHELAITAMGMPILDALDLEVAAETGARLGRHHFLLHVAPLAVPGATGSPVNPIATF